MRSKKLLIIILSIVGALALVLLGVILARFVFSSPQLLPSDISRSISFSPLVVSPTNTVSATNYDLSQVEDGTTLLTYTITSGQATIEVSQYPEPSQFADIPDFRSKFLADVIQQTGSVSSASGTLYLGQMAKQKNKQLAVMLEKGLIVFLMPDRSLDETQWRAIGDSLTVITPTRL